MSTLAKKENVLYSECEKRNRILLLEAGEKDILPMTSGVITVELLDTGAM